MMRALVRVVAALIVVWIVTVNVAAAQGIPRANSGAALVAAFGALAAYDALTLLGAVACLYAAARKWPPRPSRRKRRRYVRGVVDKPVKRPTGEPPQGKPGTLAQDRTELLAYQLPGTAAHRWVLTVTDRDAVAMSADRQGAIAKALETIAWALRSEDGER